jgi:hypothetical protein
MIIPPSRLVGWASRVETWCFTFSKGRDWTQSLSETAQGAYIKEVRGGHEITVSFSTIALAPRTEADSKVNMDCSRCSQGQQEGCTVTWRNAVTNVEVAQVLAIRVKGVVVKLDELLCSGKV